MALFDSKVAKFLVTDSGGTADKWSLRRYRHDRPRGRPWPSQDAHGGGGLFIWAKGQYVRLP